MNRWLSVSSILFRILCLYQPGGSTERANLLGQLVSPEVCKGFPDSVRVRRTWQQGLQRAGEINATPPDASLLLKGVDSSTSVLLSSHPMLAFRVNAFWHGIALENNPRVTGTIVAG